MKKPEYDIGKIKDDLRDEYMAAMLVGYDENTPDVMDIEFASGSELILMAERYGLNLEEYKLKEDDEA